MKIHREPHITRKNLINAVKILIELGFRINEKNNDDFIECMEKIYDAMNELEEKIKK